jgi:hypothetical protein
MRKFPTVVAATALTVAAGVLGASHASALGGETLGCRFAPGPAIPFSQYCTNRASARSYNLGFLVQNEGSGTTYAWSVPAEYVSSINGGCTATSSSCSLTVPNGDAYIAVSVTLTQDGASETLTSYASESRYCGSQLC